MSYPALNPGAAGFACDSGIMKKELAKALIQESLSRTPRLAKIIISINFEQKTSETQNRSESFLHRSLASVYSRWQHRPSSPRTSGSEICLLPQR